MLSVCVVAKNEADLLAECLDSVKGVASELLVLDHGSTDATAQVAAAAGARVLTTSAAFSEQARNELLTTVDTPWVLSLDADERLSRAGQERMRGVMETAPPNVLGFAVERFDYLGRGHFASTRLVRLFRSLPSVRWSMTRTHATVVPSLEAAGGDVALAPIGLHHLDALLQRDHAAKRARRTALMERDLADGALPYLRCFLALEYFLLGEDRRGTDELERSFSELPRCEPLARLLLAQHHRTRARLEQAEVEVRRALSLDPASRGRASALLLLTDLLHRRGAREDALVAAQEALEVSCGSAGARLALAALTSGAERTEHLRAALVENDWLATSRPFAEATPLSPMHQQDVVLADFEVASLS